MGDVEHPADEELQEQSQDSDRKLAKGRQDPGEPTAEERRIHDITHLPYRSWCAECVAGRGVGFAHTSHEALAEDALPIVGIDYHYMGAEGEEGTIPMVCLKDSHTKVVFDHVVTKKGVDKYMVKRVLTDLIFLGYRRLIMKSDQEPALVALTEEVQKEFHGNIIFERSPVQQSSSNGMIESGIRTCGSQIRVMKAALEKKIGEISSDHNCLSWLVEHAAFLVTCFGIGRDGKEPYRLLKGR